MVDGTRCTPHAAEVPHRTAVELTSAPLVPGEHYITPSYLCSAGIPFGLGYLLYATIYGGFMELSCSTRSGNVR